jgi:hypothetical protein
VFARAFSFEVGLHFVVVRATLLRADPGHPGGMAAVAASEEKVARYISKSTIALLSLYTMALKVTLYLES